MFAFIKREIFDYFGFHKYLKEAGYNFIELLAYITINNYKNNFKQLKDL